MIVKMQGEIEDMADRAKLLAGWDEGGHVPLGGLDGEDPSDPDGALDNRRYAEGVEAGLRWALGWGNQPFPSWA
jgi:hypothetical protein